MIYAVLFEDNNDRADMRTKHMSDHLAFLRKNARKINAAGPLIDTADKTPAGGLWLVEAENHQAVSDLVEADPFYATGLRKSMRILQWSQVFSNE